MDTPQPTGGPPTDEPAIADPREEPSDVPGSGEVPGPDGGVPIEDAEDEGQR